MALWALEEKRQFSPFLWGGTYASGIPGYPRGGGRTLAPSPWLDGLPYLKPRRAVRRWSRRWAFAF
jgi:hypothetical protein